MVCQSILYGRTVKSIEQPVDTKVLLTVYPLENKG